MTEQEIYEGILNTGILEPWKTSIVFVRNIKDIEQNVSKDVELSKKFIDLNMDETINTQIKDHLNELKNVHIPEAYKNFKDISIMNLEPVYILNKF